MRTFGFPKLAVPALLTVLVSPFIMGFKPPPAPAVSPSTATLAADPLPFALGSVDGYGDYHIHQLSSLGYDGRLLWGSYQGSEGTALKSCSGHNHAVNWIPGFVTNLFHQAEVGMHTFGTKGYDSNSSKRYKDWPLWKTVTHQQVWEGWLKKAHDDGLNLIVMSAVNFRYICGIMPAARGFDDRSGGVKPCDDMKNVRRQIIAAKEFAAARSWYEIVLTPEHARRAIQEGKLAVVLAIETSEIFKDVDNETELRAALNEYYDLGVRSIQPVHELDNQFSGTAYFQGLFDIVQAFVNVKEWAGSGFSGGIDELSNAIKGIQLDSNDHNVKGLSPLGKRFIQLMMDKKMVVDLAHMSQRAFNDTYNIAVQNDYYPLLLSHGHYREMYTGKKVDEKKVSPDGIRKIKRTGGIFGLRTGNERRRTYTRSGVANNCSGSTRSWAQSYMLGAVGYGIPQGFASDMNGFIDQIRPRYYDSGSKWSGNDPKKWACGSDANHPEAELAQQQQGNRFSNGTGTDFDLIGYAHIGLTKQVIRDLNKLGVATVQLEDSAESFLGMWDRAYSPSRGPESNTIDNSGIVTEHSDEKCPGLRTKLGSYSAKPVCKALPHFKIKERKCDGSKWNGYCIWNKGSWYKARQLK